MNLKCPLILASKSPRRQLLLKQLGLKFSVQSMDVEESFPSEIKVSEVASFLAEKKAKAFESNLTNELVLTADTVVILGNTILGKPNSRDEAIDMIQSLSGVKHEVTTGVCLLSRGYQKNFDDTTYVHFRKLELSEIEYYVDNFEPYDKAGAYGIQEWLGMVAIDKIVGSYFNVMGLPLNKVYDHIREFEVNNT